MAISPLSVERLKEMRENERERRGVPSEALFAPQEAMRIKQLKGVTPAAPDKDFLISDH